MRAENRISNKNKNEESLDYENRKSQTAKITDRITRIPKQSLQRLATADYLKRVTEQMALPDGNLKAELEPLTTSETSDLKS